MAAIPVLNQFDFASFNLKVDRVNRLITRCNRIAKSGLSFLAVGALATSSMAVVGVSGIAGAVAVISVAVALLFGLEARAAQREIARTVKLLPKQFFVFNAVKADDDQWESRLERYGCLQKYDYRRKVDYTVQEWKPSRFFQAALKIETKVISDNLAKVQAWRSLLRELTLPTETRPHVSDDILRGMGQMCSQPQDLSLELQGISFLTAEEFKRYLERPLPTQSVNKPSPSLAHWIFSWVPRPYPSPHGQVLDL